MKIKFDEMADGSLFMVNEIQFRKIALVKISCCKSVNAEATSDTKNRIYINPNSEIEVND